MRVAKSEEERALLWKGRKNAFRGGRAREPDLLRSGWCRTHGRASPIRCAFHPRRFRKRYGLTISNIFHAGDGNMHPIILFDPRKPDELEKTQKAGAEILEYCVNAGGAITGEHGVGMEKNDLMPLAFSQDSLDMMETLIKVFDPDRRLNPGKVLPTGKGCLEIRPMTNRTREMVW